LKKPGLIQRIDFLTTDHLRPGVVFDQPERMLFSREKRWKLEQLLWWLVKDHATAYKFSELIFNHRSAQIIFSDSHRSSSPRRGL